MPESDLTARVTQLEAEVQELKAVQDLLLRLLSTVGRDLASEPPSISTRLVPSFKDRTMMLALSVTTR